jgi:uncharacterized CHY-type Zn-finger protein
VIEEAGNSDMATFMRPQDSYLDRHGREKLTTHGLLRVTEILSSTMCVLCGVCPQA